MPDENRSNVYKLFRASRVSSDTTIDPTKQQAFYDPGLGSKMDGGWIKWGWGRWLYNMVSQATGLGITRNLIDCYAEIIRLYEPGDRIWLFGFSRGAYTVRCVGGVLANCGVPTRRADGTALRRDPKSIRSIAEEGVKRVYQHGSGRAAERFREQRKELGRRFRSKYNSGTRDEANVAPYFIGVWDTVASTGVRWPIFLLLLVAFIVACAVGAYSLHTGFFGGVSFWRLFAALFLGAGAIGWFLMLVSRFRASAKTSHSWFATVHLTGWRMRFYDQSLNEAVRYAKHALAIDERRRDFARVAWETPGTRTNDDSWFEQIWFAGNHSDVGGSYPENEARLSDISLRWMVDRAQACEFGLDVDDRFLNVSPASDGMQHDEIKASILPWAEKVRDIPVDAPLHPTVLERFKGKAVLHYDETKLYRPDNLKGHSEVTSYFE